MKNTIIKTIDNLVFWEVQLAILMQLYQCGKSTNKQIEDCLEELEKRRLQETLILWEIDNG